MVNETSFAGILVAGDAVSTDITSVLGKKMSYIKVITTEHKGSGGNVNIPMVFIFYRDISSIFLQFKIFDLFPQFSKHVSSQAFRMAIVKLYS